MSPESPLSLSQHIVQVWLFIIAGIAILGSTLQMHPRKPETSVRLGNVHGFMTGAYLSTGFTCRWAAFTARQQGFRIYLLCLGVLLAGSWRLIFIAKAVCLPHAQSGLGISFQRRWYLPLSTVPNTGAGEMCPDE